MGPMRNYLGVAGAVVAVLLVFALWTAREMTAIHEQVIRTDQRIDRLEERIARMQRRLDAEAAPLPGESPEAAP